MSAGLFFLICFGWEEAGVLLGAYDERVDPPIEPPEQV